MNPWETECEVCGMPAVGLVPLCDQHKPLPNGLLRARPLTTLVVIGHFRTKFHVLGFGVREVDIYAYPANPLQLIIGRDYTLFNDDTDVCTVREVKCDALS